MNLFQTLLRLPTRQLCLMLFAVCAGLLAYGLYLQHVVGLEPCPMCIMQRYAFVGVALLALVAGLHAPGRTGQRIYLAGIGALALTGGGVAARQSWIQRNPPDIPECGPDLAFMLDAFPLAQALPMIFSGSGDCASIDWTFLGLTIANWSLLCFSAVVVFAVWLLWRRVPKAG
ncbi:MAG: disulfide bond formation protein B [Rhodocyclaceae bacterium]